MKKFLKVVMTLTLAFGLLLVPNVGKAATPEEVENWLASKAPTDITAEDITTDLGYYFGATIEVVTAAELDVLYAPLTAENVEAMAVANGFANTADLESLLTIEGFLADGKKLVDTDSYAIDILAIISASPVLAADSYSKGFLHFYTDFLVNDEKFGPMTHAQMVEKMAASGLDFASYVADPEITSDGYLKWMNNFYSLAEIDEVRTFFNEKFMDRGFDSTETEKLTQFVIDTHFGTLANTYDELMAFGASFFAVQDQFKAAADAVPSPFTGPADFDAYAAAEHGYWTGLGFESAYFVNGQETTLTSLYLTKPSTTPAMWTLSVGGVLYGDVVGDVQVVSKALNVVPVGDSVSPKPTPAVPTPTATPSTTASTTPTTGVKLPNTAGDFTTGAIAGMMLLVAGAVVLRKRSSL